MKLSLKIFVLLFGSVIIFLPGCYTRFASEERNYDNKNNSGYNDNLNDRYNNQDTNSSSDYDNAPVVNNYYSEGFYSPRRYFSHYYPSYGFSISYGHIYDPFWGDPWWAADYYYQPCLIYNPYWTAYSFGWGGGFVYNHHSYASGSNNHDRYRSHIPADEGRIRDGGGRRSGIAGRDLIRLSSVNRSRDIGGAAGFRQRDVGGIPGLRNRNYIRSSRAGTDAAVSRNQNSRVGRIDAENGKRNSSGTVGKSNPSHNDPSRVNRTGENPSRVYKQTPTDKRSPSINDSRTKTDGSNRISKPERVNRSRVDQPRNNNGSRRDGGSISRPQNNSGGRSSSSAPKSSSGNNNNRGSDSKSRNQSR